MAKGIAFPRWYLLLLLAGAVAGLSACRVAATKPTRLGPKTITDLPRATEESLASPTDAQDVVAFDKPTTALKDLGEGARQPGEKEILEGGVVELARKLRGRINHVHLIDSDGTLHNDETSTHAPFNEGKIDFDELMPELAKNDMGHDWWTIDLCFWPDAWPVTEKCKQAVDELNKKYG